mgnify:CR=1 FL=1
MNKIYQKIKSLNNAANAPLTSEEEIEKQIRLVADESISPSKFKPSQVDPNIFYANSLTIAAVKKELFMVGEGFEDLEDTKECIDCSRKIDAQFWKFCPFCEGKLE